LNGIYAESPKNVFAVGDRGTILHYDGSRWTVSESGTKNLLFSVWGSSPENIYAAGGRGTLLRYDGASWKAMEVPQKGHYIGIWGRSGDGFTMVGDAGLALHFDGKEWSPLPVETDDVLRSVSGNQTGLLIAGENGNVFRIDGTRSVTLSAPVKEPVRSLWGTGSDSFFAVLESFLFHYNHGRWEALNLQEIPPDQQ